MILEIDDSFLKSHPLPSRFNEYANKLADNLSKQNDILELIPNFNRRRLAIKLTGYTLNQGIVVFKGDVNTLEAPRGGIYYIDGNVGTLEGDSFKSGIVYINGDLKLLKDTDSTMLIVTGEVGSYDQNHQSVGGLRMPINHSPFLFSPKPIKGISRAYGEYEYGGPGKQTPIEPGMAVGRDRLLNWNPREVLNKTLELCRERVALENERRMNKVSTITDPDKMIQYYFHNYEGYAKGFSRGRYSAPSHYDD